MVVKNKVRPEDRFFRRLKKALGRSVKIYGQVQLGGAFVGPGGAFVIACLSTACQPSFRQYQNPLLKIWEKNLSFNMADFQTGGPSALLSLAELMDLLPGWAPPLVFLKKCHKSLVTSLQTIRKRKAPRLLGLAHGIAGILLALEVCRMKFSLSTPPSLLNWVFDQLYEAQYSVSGASLWPIAAGDEEINMNTWCNGAPGIALALLGCYKATGKKSYLDLLTRAARGAEMYSGGDNPTICCGFAGKAHLFMEAYRLFRKKSWIQKARRILPDRPEEALPQPPFPKNSICNGLFRGAPGIAYAYDRLSDPDLALPGTGFAGNLD
jgi:lantibiotic modifying enzyme